MKTIIDRINIPEQVSDYVRMLEIDLGGYTSLIKSIIVNPLYPYDKEKFESILEKRQEKYMEFTLAQDELREAYLPIQYKKSNYMMAILYNEYCIEVFTTNSCEGDTCCL